MSERVRTQGNHAQGFGRLRLERRSDHMECAVGHWSGDRADLERLPRGEHRCPMCRSWKVYEVPEW